MSYNYNREKSKMFFILHAFMDIMLVCLGFYIVYVFYSLNDQIPFNYNLLYQLTFFIALVTFLFFQVYGVLRCGRRSYTEVVFSVFLSLLFVNLIGIFSSATLKIVRVPLSIFLFTFPVQLIFLMIWKMVVFKIYPLVFKPKMAAFVGNGPETYELAGKVLAKDNNMFNIKYIFDEIDQYTYECIKEVDVVFVCPNVDKNDKHNIIYQCIGFGKPVYIIPELFEIALFNAKMSRFDDVPAFCVENLNLSIEQRFLKRLFDITVSLILITISSPMMLIAYLGIKLYDHGPAIFKQERVTRWNKKFNLYKFRTMVLDAEKYTGPVLAVDKDPRITKLGSFLRMTRIDELPQLFNVLLGDMSIVGPRPEREFFIKQFVKEIPDFEYRLNVKAGITGLAQVLGKYTTVANDKLKFDLLYIRDYSFFLDLKIIFQTIKIMFMKASSQGVTESKETEFVKPELSGAFNKH